MEMYGYSIELIENNIWKFKIIWRKTYEQIYQLS